MAAAAGEKEGAADYVIANNTAFSPFHRAHAALLPASSAKNCFTPPQAPLWGKPYSCSDIGSVFSFGSQLPYLPPSLPHIIDPK